MKSQSESIEARLEVVRSAVDALFRVSPNEMQQIGVMWTFDDVVIIKDWNTGKLYELPYSIVTDGIQFGEPAETDEVFVTKRLQGLEATTANAKIMIGQVTILQKK